MSEKLSQLIDRELAPEQCEEQFDRLCAGDGYAKPWQNYHFIGSVIRGEIASAGIDLSPRISVALNNEPTVLAPRALNKDSRLTGDIWKPISMFAIAASLALVAVITLNPADKVSGQNQLASTTAPAESIQQQKFAQEFAVMLVEHGEFTATAGLNGLVAYAKLVSNQRLDQ
jgi:negative regulator of sigma E activity